MSRIVGIIPARLDSSRLPGKLLLSETGKPLIVHTIQQAQKSHLLDEVIVATGDQEIAEACKKYCRVILTKEEHPNGTSRITEAVKAIGDAEIVVNIQGDEPGVQPRHIDLLVYSLVSQSLHVGTLAADFDDPGDLLSTSCVKVFTDKFNDALMFSRGPVALANKKDFEKFFISRYPLNPWRHHIGVYAFHRDVLAAYPTLKVGPIEEFECLEQMRFLENAIGIRVIHVGHASGGINTLNDYKGFVCRETGIRDTQPG